MNLTLKTLVVTAALSVISASASAQALVPGTHRPRIDQRQANQEQRIDQGVDFGGQPAARAADRLIAFFFRAPALCW